jgi:hypothetical protein
MTDGADFRKQAEEARLMAARSSKQEDKEFWLRLAQDWDKLAQDAEELAERQRLKDRTSRK